MTAFSLLAMYLSVSCGSITGAQLRCLQTPIVRVALHPVPCARRSAYLPIVPKYEVFGEESPDHAIVVEADSEAAALDQVARTLGHASHAALIADGGPPLHVELNEDGFVRRPGDIYGLMPQGH